MQERQDLRSRAARRLDLVLGGSRAPMAEVSRRASGARRSHSALRPLLPMSEELCSLVHREVRATGVTPAAVAYIAGGRIE